MIRINRVAALLFVLFVFGCGDIPQPFKGDTLWKIKTHNDGSSEVVGVRLGHTTLIEFTQIIGGYPEYAFFEHANRISMIESYFGERTLGGLSGAVIASIKVDTQAKQALQPFLHKAKPTPSGAYKYKVFDEGVKVFESKVIHGFTVALKARLDDDLIKKLFGKPIEVIQDTTDEHTMHFAYPEKGLLITRGKRNKTLLQYIKPSDLPSLISKLR